MPSAQPPGAPKPNAGGLIWENRALETPKIPKSPVAASVWGLAAVRGRGDAEISRIAELQRGIVHRSQLVEAGLTSASIKHRLAIGQLHRLYPRVYLVGRPRLEPLGAAAAAAVHFGGHAVLSHRTAGLIWEILDAPELPVSVTVVGIDARSRSSLTIYRRSLSPQDVRARRGLPVTSPARTIIDLAGSVDAGELEATLALVLRRRLVTVAEVRAALERAPRSKGAATLRRMLEPGAGPTLTRSEYERKLLQLLRRAELPRPQVNAKILGHEVDFLWQEQRLVVEFDGFRYHSGRKSFEEDRLRDQRLVAAGYRVIRITGRQLDHTPEAVVARIAAALVHR